MTVREKLELLAQSEDRNAAVIAAYAADTYDAPSYESLENKSDE